MDVKQEPSDPYEEVVKTEQNASFRTEENYWCSTEQQQSVLGEIKQEIVEYGVSEEVADLPTKIECKSIHTKQSAYTGEIKQEIEDLPTKTECDSIQFLSTTIKKELDVDIGDTKEEVSEYVQAKNESELLTTHCDLPTLKSEGIDSPDYYVQPSSSKHAGRKVQTLKTTTNVSKKRKKTYPCLVCQKNFPSPKSRSKHIDEHFDYVMKYRPRKLSSKISHLSNIQQRCNNKSKCKICFKEFEKKIELHRHLINHTNEEQFKCKICFKEFKTKIELHRHLIIHTYEYKTLFKCEICFKEYSDKYSLRCHSMIHTYEKQTFKCDLCYKEFKTNFELQRHLKNHFSQKTFKCDICFKELKTKYNLQQHLKIHSNEKPLKCDICFKDFIREYFLQKHLVVHTNEKRLKCIFCSKEFYKKSYLQHLVTHNNEKQFECVICSKGFKLKPDLYRHLNTHSIENL